MSNDIDHSILVDYNVPQKASEELTLASEIKDILPDLEFDVAYDSSEFAKKLEKTEILLTFGFDQELIDNAPNLRWVQALSAGVDSYDIQKLEEKNITLTNASGVHSQPIAEQVLGYILMFERGIDKGIRQQERGVWERYTGGESKGKTVGIIGVGEIGGRVAELCSSVGMRVIGTKRDTENFNDAVNEIYGADETYEVLKQSDYIVLACPLTEETRGLIGRQELISMKSSAYLINIARGEVVDEDALTEALQQKRIKGAALDVFETEPLPSDSVLWDLPNAIVTPHMSGSTPKYWERCAEIFAENYEKYVEGREDEMTNRIV